MEFRVGDKIKAISTERQCGYSTTNSDRNWTGEVLGIEGDRIIVPCNGASVLVFPIHFALVVGNNTNGKGKRIEYKF
jgi:hypothetical protein